MNPDNGTLKPYLYGSAAVHGGLVLGIFLLAHRPATPSNEVYRIDFIGPSNVIINRNPESGPSPAAPTAPAPAGRIAPENQENEFSALPRHAPLPRPSILTASREAPKTSVPEIPKTSANANVAGPAGPSSGEAAVSADMPNFPYPWYVSQIRAALWNQWSAKMPGGGAEATVEFSILKDGSAVDVRIESSSGDQEIDYVALGAVQGALPFPPLPNGFSQQFLKVHVHFKSQ